MPTIPNKFLSEEYSPWNLQTTTNVMTIIEQTSVQVPIGTICRIDRL